MAIVDFKCLQCGRCCSFQSNGGPNKVTGISLFPRERNLFPEDIINPQVGIGRKPSDKKFKIIAYQMFENTSSLLEHNKCTIYERRPIACRAFPLYPFIIVGRGVITKVDPYCTALEKMGIENPGESIVFNPSSLSNESIYVNELAKISFQILRKFKRAWVYDSLSDKWKRFKDTARTN